MKRKRIPKTLIRSNNVVVKNPTSKSCWKTISGYEGYYEVSDKGVVRAITRDVPYKNGKMHSLKGRVIKP